MIIFDPLAPKYDLAMLPLERLVLRRLRRRLYPYLTGRVLELGVGTGTNLPLYSSSVELVAADLSEPMLHIARQRATRATTHWLLADARALPLAGESFDHVAASLFLCSVSPIQFVLDEVWRVLRPGGWLTLLEHVRGETGVMRWLTDLLARPWHRLSHSCRLDRETAQRISERGFKLLCTMRYGLGIVQIIVARKPT